MGADDKDLKLHGLEPFVELNAKLKSATDGLADLLAGFHKNALTKALSEINSLPRSFAPVTMMAESLKGLNDGVLKNLAFGQASAFAQLQERLSHTIWAPGFVEFLANLPRFTIPSAALLGLGEARFGPTGVLAGLGPAMPSALSWIGADTEGCRVESVALSSERQPPALVREIVIDTDVRCVFCDETMYAQRSEQWTSSVWFRVSLKVLPLCAKCAAELAPGEMLERLHDLARPKLELISGGGEDPASPSKEHLRLVSRDDDEE